MTGAAFETAKMEFTFGEPLVADFFVALKAYIRPLCHRKVFVGLGVMRVVTIIAKGQAYFRMVASRILVSRCPMAPTAIDRTQPLGVGDLTDIGMAVCAEQLSVDRRCKFFVVEKKTEFSFCRGLLLFGRHDHAGPFILRHFQDILGAVAVEALFVFDSMADGLG
jgi:hypothetical protein